MKNDYQKNKVYNWEWQYVSPFSKDLINIKHIQNMINSIWSDMGLLYPPSVELLSKKNKNLGEATRISISFKEEVYSFIILHELAHCMTTEENGNCAFHGPLFVGMYVKLLVKYLRLNEEQLIKSLDDNKIDYNLNAKPLFID